MPPIGASLLGALADHIRSLADTLYQAADCLDRFATGRRPQESDDRDVFPIRRPKRKVRVGRE